MAHRPTGSPPAEDEPGAARAEVGREMSGNDVAAYLRRHRDFLAKRPELFGLLAAPARDIGANVVDLQQILLEKLRAENARLKLTQRKLIANSRSNQAIQSRVHQAVLALLAATTFEHLIAAVTDELALVLDIDAVGLCLEATHGAAGHVNRLSGGRMPGIQILAAGSVDELLGEGRDVLLRPDVVGDPHLFGMSAASLVRSDALVRLSISSKSPTGLLAMGSRRLGSFNPGQGTELLTFLANVIEHSIRAWLHLPD